MSFDRSPQMVSGGGVGGIAGVLWPSGGSVHSRAEDDFEADAAAADEVEMLHRAAAGAAADAREARREAELLSEQCDVLKEALRDAARDRERERTLTSPVSVVGGDGVGGAASGAATAPDAAATNLTFLKNAVVKWMVAGDLQERRKMLPAIALLLRLSPQEIAKVNAALDAAATPIRNAISSWLSPR